MTDAAGEQRVEDVMKRWRALSDDDPWRDDVEVLYARLRAVEAERNQWVLATQVQQSHRFSAEAEVQRLAAEMARLRAALEAVIYAGDQCLGHRGCGHSMEPWQQARAALTPPHP